MRKQKKDWSHNRFLKQQEERKAKKAYESTRKVLTDVCRIVGHDVETTHTPSGSFWTVLSTTNRCKRCGTSWIYTAANGSTYTVTYTYSDVVNIGKTGSAVWLDTESTGATYNWTTGTSI